MSVEEREFEAIGLIKSNAPDHISENEIRRQLGMPTGAAHTREVNRRDEKHG